MVFVSSYYNKDVGSCCFSFSTGVVNGTLEENLAVVRKEIDRVCPVKKRLVNKKDSLQIAWLPHMNINPKDLRDLKIFKEIS